MSQKFEAETHPRNQVENEGSGKPSHSWLHMLDDKIEALLLALPAVNPSMNSGDSKVDRFEISEFDLTQTLIDENIFPKACLKNPESLFKTHFLIKSSLFRIQKLWREDHFALLAIELTKISWVFIDSASHLTSDLTQHSPNQVGHLNQNAEVDTKLYNYYQDWSQFENTTGDDVVKMIDDFWHSFAEYLSAPNDQKAMYFADVLDIDCPIENLTYSTLKQKFRLKANRLHPDKGGSHDEFVALQQAYKGLQLRLNSVTTNAATSNTSSD